jgi:alkane 1-monooxygenase
MRLRAFKYLSPLIIYVGAFNSFIVTGWQIWLPLIFAWVIIPLLELIIQPRAANLSEAEESIVADDKRYDILLYFIFILQYAAICMFLYGMSHDKMTVIDIAGRIWVMGLLCGIFGINVGHELGHRSKPFEQTLAKLLLLTSQYMHFFIEHNKGHHKRVATPDDPSSAHYGEPVYAFYFRTVIFSYIHAWQIANREVGKKQKSVFSLANEMVRFSVFQILFVVTIFLLVGWMVTLYYLAAATIGFILLETVNYIEHYALQRRSLGDGKYERAMPVHSWNSNHVMGRVMLFELSRHSDHHYLASRKYQLLRHHDDSPQMPTGYPGMMVLSLLPPLWFYVMNKRVKAFNQQMHLKQSTVITS